MLDQLLHLGLKEQLEEDWGLLADKAVIIRMSPTDFQVVTPHHTILVYSLWGDMWVSRTLQEYMQE